MPREVFEKESARGLQVWRIRGPSAMATAHIHADLEVNLVRKGEPLRYLQRGRILEIPVGRMAMFWGGIPHHLLSSESAVDGVWLTLPLPWARQWNLHGDPHRQRVMRLEMQARVHRMLLNLAKGSPIAHSPPALTPCHVLPRLQTIRRQSQPGTFPPSARETG